MTTAVTLLGRALPATVERTVHVLDQGQTISCRGHRWRNVLAVVEHGAIEIQTAYGGRAHLDEGASFFVTRLAALIKNTGAGHAVVATVRRVPADGSQP